MHYDLRESPGGGGEGPPARLRSAWKPSPAHRRSWILRPSCGPCTRSTACLPRPSPKPPASSRSATTPRGTRLVSSGGEPSKFLWIIRKGAVRLERQGQTAATLEEGDVLGYPSMLSGKGSFDVFAEEDLLAYLLPESVFHELLSSRPLRGFSPTRSPPACATRSRGLPRASSPRASSARASASRSRRAASAATRASATVSIALHAIAKSRPAARCGWST